MNFQCFVDAEVASSSLNVKASRSLVVQVSLKPLRGTNAVALILKTIVVKEKHRHLLGEDITLSVKELQNLENNLKVHLQCLGKERSWKWCTFHVLHSQSNHMDCEQPDPVLQIGYQQYMAADGPSGSRSMAVESNIIHGWGL
ncbi:transcription factor [Datura stramonium]|uniref:Transcription factor n=1 Tax=Datura stramonium TaxID=4076 RepID=A0ABS8T9E9_DATST|nr:transcription factor [Datura stramonium]